MKGPGYTGKTEDGVIKLCTVSWSYSDLPKKILIKIKHLKYSMYAEPELFCKDGLMMHFEPRLCLLVGPDIALRTFKYAPSLAGNGRAEKILKFPRGR
jgi:hypothetical protein